MSMRSLLRPVAERLQRLVWWWLDTYDSLRGKKHPMAPPRHMMNVGSASYSRNDFHSIADELLAYLKQHAELKSNDSVLDVGCGVGRLAIALDAELKTPGYYEGFDIIEASISHCKKRITTQNPLMRFKHADVFNSYYNPLGQYTSESYQFPYPSDHFSLVLLTSVFTHMLFEGVENYLKEIHRVLKPGGRCFITFFLLNEQTEELLAQQRTSIAFYHSMTHGKSSSAHSPEAAMAFHEPYIEQLFHDVGFDIQDPILRGSWCDRPSDVGFQDVIVAVKRES